jgi:hypothetical protein
METTSLPTGTRRSTRQKARNSSLGTPPPVSPRDASSTSPPPITKRRRVAAKRKVVHPAKKTLGPKAILSDDLVSASDLEVDSPRAQRRATTTEPTVVPNDFNWAQQLALLTPIIREIASSLHPPDSSLHSPTPQPSTRSVTWKDLNPLELSVPEKIDLWFMAFETKLSASQIPPSHWAQKFVECPHVPPELKSRLPSHILNEYRTIRRSILDDLGPRDPVGFFRASLYAVSGTSRETIKRQLEEILVLHNRACVDRSEPVWEKRTLLYPFIRAFPEPTRTTLFSDLGFALGFSDPVEQLFYRAPATSLAFPDLPSSLCPVSVPLTQSAVPAPFSINAVAPPNYRRESRGNSLCQGCGGQCASRSQCPAFGRDCHNCGTPNHFASCCRKARSVNATQSPASPPNSFPFRPRQQRPTAP